MKQLSAWEIYLSQKMDFPFDAEIIVGDDSQLKDGDRVVVEKIEGYDDFWGIIAFVKFGKKKYQTMLSDLELIDVYSHNYKLFEEYIAWYEAVFVKAFYKLGRMHNSSNANDYISIMETEEFSLFDEDIEPVALRDVIEELSEIEGLDGDNDDVEEIDIISEEILTDDDLCALEEFQGLSRTQLQFLCDESLTVSGSIVEKNRPGKPEYFQNTPIIKWGMFFLEQLKKAGQLKATAKGNLPLSFAQMVYDNFGYERKRKLNSEEDSSSVNKLRHLLLMAGWIKFQKKKFSITKKGEKIITKGITGNDYIHLLSTYTLKFNWDYLDWYQGVEILQHTFMFSLYLLYKKGDKFVEIDELVNDYTKAFPFIIDNLSKTYKTSDIYDIIRLVFQLRIINNLCYNFGFVEIKDDNEVRTTELFKKCYVWKV